MTLQVLPDPDRPTGGSAILVLPAGGLAGTSVTVAIGLRGEGMRWLAPGAGDTAARIGTGEGDWRPEMFRFGPYPVIRDGAAARVVIGPEIVNKLREYLPVTVRIDGVDHALSWPDTIRTRPGAPIGGAIPPGAALPRDGNPTGRPADTTPEPPPVETTAPPPPQQRQPEPEADPKPSPVRRWLVPAGLAALVLAAAAVWLLWPEAERTAVVPPAPAPPHGPDCTYAGLSATAGGFAAVVQRLRACQGAVDRDTALRLIEDGASRTDPLALLALAGLYDTDVADPVLQGALGLDGGDEPALAAEYYARARAAGAPDAATRLAAVCQRLAQRADTMSRSAHDDFCR